MRASTSDTTIIIGSRGSDLALAQSRYIAARLGALPNAQPVEIEIIQTRGDRILDVPLAQVASVRENHNDAHESSQDVPTSATDRKGVFTKELEDALLDGRVDLAVHSYKDLPSLMPDGLCIAALPERVDPEDVLVFRRDRMRSPEPPYILDAATTQTRLGTSSVRRQALLKFRFPEIECVDLRGNVPTRIKKLFADEDPLRPDAILLARAGIDRLRTAGYFAAHPEMQALLDQLEIRPLSVDWFPPAPAQGALAIQCRSDDTTMRALLAQLHDARLETCLDVERGILKALEGGCHLPLGAHCRLDATQESEAAALTAHVFLGSDAEDNFRRRTFVLERYGSNASELTARIVEEIKTQLPIIVTGKADRLAELRDQHANAPLIAFPLLDTIETFSEDSRIGKDFDNWVMGQTPGARRLLAVFSVAGVRALHNLIQETGHNLTGIEWGVVGHKTAEALRDLIGAEYRFLSPDGTGAGLARLLAEHPVPYDAVLALSAEKGREDFYEILFDHGIATLKLSLYRTQSRAPEPAEYLRLPEAAYVVFGSPSAARAFFQGMERAWPPGPERDRREAGWRYCALGPTTRDALRELGKSVYVCAKVPDYDQLITDLFL